MSLDPASKTVDARNQPIAPGQFPRVVVTRAESNDGPLSSQLRSMGLPVLLWPAVDVVAADSGPLEEALRRVEQFDWIVFASRYAVAAVTERLPVAPTGLRVAAIGQATAQVLRQRGWPVDLLPSEANAASLVSAFAAGPRAAAATVEGEARVVASSRGELPSDSAGGSLSNAREGGAPGTPGQGQPLASAQGIPDQPLAGAKVLFPASSRALPIIAAGLTQLGAQVLQVEAYRTEAASLDVEDCHSWIARGEIGAVTFASPSAVIELERALGKESFDRLLSGAQAIAIGPTTARELAERGGTPVLAESATLQGLALTTYRILQTRQ